EALAPYRDDPSALFRNRDDIKRIVAAHLERGSTAHWLAILEPADIWCSRVLTWPELMESEGFRVLDMLQTVTREDGVSILTTRVPIRVDGSRPSTTRAAPRVGEQSEAIRAEFGL